MYPRLKVLLIALATSGLLSAQVAEAKAIAVAPSVNPLQGMLQSDVVVAGKVKEIEKDASEAAPFPNQPKVAYSVAVVEIKDDLIGAGALTQVRVGFIGVPAAPASEPAPPNGPVPIGGLRLGRPFNRGNQNLQIAKDQEGIFFLQKHPTADFFVHVPWCLPVDAKAANYKEELARLKGYAGAVDNPVKALTVADKKARYENLQFLMQRYQTFRPKTPATPAKQIDLPAEENKLVVGLIGALSWDKPDPEANNATMQSFFYMLQPSPANGFVQPTNTGQPNYNQLYGEAAANWVRENADKIRVKKFASE